MLVLCFFSLPAVTRVWRADHGGGRCGTAAGALAWGRGAQHHRHERGSGGLCALRRCRPRAPALRGHAWADGLRRRRCLLWHPAQGAHFMFVCAPKFVLNGTE
jgi:hypothetical protein